MSDESALAYEAIANDFGAKLAIAVTRGLIRIPSDVTPGVSPAAAATTNAPPETAEPTAPKETELEGRSYLLHPPLLDERGFASATRWFVDGFTKRSGIQVHCDIPDSMERLPENVKLALFRLL